MSKEFYQNQITNRETLRTWEQGFKPQIKEVLVAGNRGPCGGVNMALEAATQVLDLVAGREPVYSNWDIVNNKPIMERLSQRGLVSVRNNWDIVPEKSIVFFSAHGVPPRFHEIAKDKGFLTIDTTCQLVTRVHNLAKRAEANGQHVVYVGVQGHPETEGVLGELQQGNISLIQRAEDVDGLALTDSKSSIVYSQTTLGTDEITDTMHALRNRFPDINIPPKHDLCYATDNRQAAVDQLVDEQNIDFLLIVGSKHSHNSQELVRKAKTKGIRSTSIDRPEQIKKLWFYGVKKVGLSSGASVIDPYTEAVLDVFRNQEIPIRYLPQTRPEKDMTFQLPEQDIQRIQQRYQ